MGKKKGKRWGCDINDNEKQEMETEMKLENQQLKLYKNIYVKHGKQG